MQLRLKSAFASFAFLGALFPALLLAQQPVPGAGSLGVIHVRVRMTGNSTSGVQLTLTPVPGPFPATVPDTAEAMAAYLNIWGMPQGPPVTSSLVVMTSEQARQSLARTTGTTGISAAGGTATEPVLRQNVQPQYSDAGRLNRIQGTVELMIVVGPDGLVSGAEVMKSVGYGLDEKAVEAVRKWTFTPSTRNGVPVAVYVRVLTNFSLRDGPRRTAVSDAQGNATFGDLAPGRYIVAGRIEGNIGVVEANIAPAGVAEVTLSLSPAATLTGHVYDSSGMPVSNARVSLGVVTRFEGRSTFMQGLTVVTNGRGEYSVAAVGPGDYHILAQTPPGASTFSVYHPGTAELEKATSVSISAGQDLVGIDIVVPR